jgi:predicted DNA-binding transcriptional regulator AlpA
LNWIDPRDVTSRKKLSTYEAAAYLGLGKSTLDKMRVTGIGPAFIKIGKRVVYDPADLEAWSAQHKRSNTSQSAAAAA